MRKQKIPFTQVSNHVLNNAGVSGKAKGVYAYLYSKPDDWDFSSDRIADDFKEGRRSILASIKELENFGYLLRERLQSGKMEYTLYQEPHKNAPSTKTAQSKKRTKPKPHSAEIGPISNKDNAVYSKSNKDIKKDTSIPKEAEASPGFVTASIRILIFQMIKHFYKSSYLYKTSKDFLYFHMDKPQITYLVKTHGEEKVCGEWADEIRKLIELDGYTEEQIDWIIKFAKEDPFWSENIISMEKFRKKDNSGVPYFVVMIGKLKESVSEKKLQKKKIL